VSGIGHLRNQHRVGFGLGDGVEVLQPPLRIESVDAYHNLASAEAAGGNCVRHLRPSGDLALGCNGILEVEDDGIDRQGARLLDGAGIGARHVEYTPARTDGHVEASI
jgi:hypothetical protein